MDNDEKLPDIPELPSNSIMKKEEKRQIKARRVESKKKNVWWESLRGVGNYIFLEVLIPAAKAVVTDVFSNGIEMLLYGETGRSRSKSRDRDKSYVSYTGYYDRDRDRDRDHDRGRRRSRYNFEDIILDTRADADDVLEQMYAALDEYNAVTVSEFFELVGLKDDYTDQNYGWTNLRAAEVRRIRDGYVLDLPDPRPLPR